MATSDIFAQMSWGYGRPFAIDGNSSKILRIGTETVSNRVVLHTSAVETQEMRAQNEAQFERGQQPASAKHAILDSRALLGWLCSAKRFKRASITTGIVWLVPPHSTSRWQCQRKRDPISLYR